MPSARQRYGQWAEDEAAIFLRSHGYRLLDRHVTSRYGELDLVAEDGKTLVIIEVKARQSARFGRAVEAVTKRKLIRLRLATEEYLQKKGWNERPVRIDVLTCDESPSGPSWKLITGVE